MKEVTQFEVLGEFIKVKDEIARNKINANIINIDDYTGETDAIKLQNAIDSIENGGTILLARNIDLGNTIINFNRDNISISGGLNKYEVRFSGNIAFKVGRYDDGGSYINGTVIDNISFKYYGETAISTNPKNAVISIWNSSSPVISNCNFEDKPQIIYLRKTVNARIENIKSLAYASHVDLTSGVEFSAIKCDDNGAQNMSLVIRGFITHMGDASIHNKVIGINAIGDVRDMLITDTEINACDVGINIEPTGNSPYAFDIIMNNLIMDIMKGYGIKLTNINAGNVTIANSWISMSDNKVGGYSDAISLNGSSNVTINGCTIQGDAALGFGARGVVLANSTANSVSNNIMYSTRIGVHGAVCSLNKISGNVINFNSDNITAECGIKTDDSNNNIITENIVKSIKKYDIGIFCSGGSSYGNILRSNKVGDDSANKKFAVASGDYIEFDIPDVITELVTTNIGIGATIQITAPSKENYVFIGWLPCATSGWVSNDVVIELPWNPTTNVRNINTEQSGTIICTAVYRKATIIL